MDWQDIFKSTNLKCVVSIDDDWNYHNTAEAVLYDIYQLPNEERTRLFAEIDAYDSAIADALKIAITEMEKICFVSEDKYSVSTNPGRIALQVIPNLAYSAATDFTKLHKAVFAPA